MTPSPQTSRRAERAPCSGALSKPEFLERVRRSNQACQEGEFALAVRLYTEALSADPQNCILYSNRSAAHLRLGQYSTALDDAIKARLINPKWPKVRGAVPGDAGRLIPGVFGSLAAVGTPCRSSQLEDLWRVFGVIEPGRNL